MGNEHEMYMPDDQYPRTPVHRKIWRNMRKHTGKYCAPMWRPVLALVLPFAFLPLCLVFETQILAARCGYVMILMGLYWVFELVPLPITGLLPVILFPLLGVQPAIEVSKAYFQDSVMLFVGGLLVAIAVEHTNLHRRIALRMLTVVGSKPYWIMAGFMAISATLSMFISNTATTAMILPIAIAVIMELNKQRMRTSASRATLGSHDSGSFIVEKKRVRRETKPELYELTRFTNSSTANIADVADEAEEKVEDFGDFKIQDLPQRQQEIAKALVLCVAYASSIGGMATLTGTLTNVVFKGQFDSIYDRNENVLSYANFSSFAFPTMILCLLFAWCWLASQFFLIPYLRTGKSDGDAQEDADIRKMLQWKYEELGPWRFEEGSALFVFISLVLLWFFRAPGLPGFVKGWDSAFNDDYISDATPALFMAFLLFIWPNQIPCRARDPDIESERIRPILSWKVVTQKFPWDVILLLGGSLALAEGVTASGLTEVLKDQLQTLRGIPRTGLAALLALIVTFCTEFASNAAMATIFLPVVAKLAEASDVHPLFYMLPVTLSCSFAFMFPVATPPNAIAFGCGFLRVWDMIKAGFVLNVGCMGIMLGCVFSIGNAIFDLDHYPDWALPQNSTTPLPKFAENMTMTLS